MVVAEGPRTRALLARRRRRRQRLLVVAGILAVAALLGVAVLAYVNRSRPQAPVGDPGPRAATSAAPAPAPAGPAPSFPVTGPNSFSYAGGSDQVLGGGTADPRRYRVAVENGTGQDPAGFAAAVGRILGDPRGWT